MPSAVLLLRFLLKIRSVRILDTIACLGTFLWLFSLAWDAVKLTLKVGFACPFMVIDHTNLGATILVSQAWCLTVFNLSPTQKTCLFTNGNKASVYACWREMATDEVQEEKHYRVLRFWQAQCHKTWSRPDSRGCRKFQHHAEIEPMSAKSLWLA